MRYLAQWTALELLARGGVSETAEEWDARHTLQIGGGTGFLGRAVLCRDALPHAGEDQVAEPRLKRLSGAALVASRFPLALVGTPRYHPHSKRFFTGEPGRGPE